MTMQSGFFNSVNGDRKYNGNFLSDYFASFIGNGVFPNPSNNFQVITNNDMTVTVVKGKGWIDGVFCFDKSDYILSIDVAEGQLNRIDRVVLRLDTTQRDIQIAVKKGTPATEPSPKLLQRDADIYELAIADIYIGKGVTGIGQENITDKRLDTDLCGMVTGVIEQVDTETLFIQYENWMENKKDDMNDWYYSTKAELENEFYIWFNGLQDVFDESAEGNILTKVEEINNKVIANRNEILDVRLKLSEESLLNFLNKTGIGFYDLFKNLKYTNDTLTTANVDVFANKVKFINSKVLKMKEQNYNSFNGLELNIYDSERRTIEAIEDSVINKVKVLVQPGSIKTGDKFYYNKKVYTVSTTTTGI